MAKGIVATKQYLTAKKAQFTLKKVKRTMRNQFRKPKNVNCAYSVFPKQTNLEAKIHERSEWIYASA